MASGSKYGLSTSIQGKINKNPLKKQIIQKISINTVFGIPTHGATDFDDCRSGSVLLSINKLRFNSHNQLLELNKFRFNSHIQTFRSQNQVKHGWTHLLDYMNELLPNTSCPCINLKHLK